MVDNSQAVRDFFNWIEQFDWNYVLPFLPVKLRNLKVTLRT